MKIIIDTREQAPFAFEHGRYADTVIESGTLSVGDYSLPPNPAKLTDTRSKEYVREYGTESWELDSLEPGILTRIITENIDKYINKIKFEQAKVRQDQERGLLREVAKQGVEFFGVP